MCNDEKAPTEAHKELRPEGSEAPSIGAVTGLVTGVSHEINIPLDVNIGNSTLLIELLDELSKKYHSGSLDAESLAEFLETAQELSASMLKNMRSASKLLSTF